jgi:predicted dehydrogenase
MSGSASRHRVAPAEWGVVIAGAGLMGRWHAHALRRAGGRIVAVADPDISRREALARRENAIGVASLSDALSLGIEIDAVHVCAPLHAHVSLVRESLERGCHVLVEKPLAPSASVTADLLALATARGRLLCPVHQFLFQPGAQATLATLPQLGAIHHLDYVACTAGADAADGPQRHSIAIGILPHPLSLITRLLARPLGSVDWSVATPDHGEIRATTIAGGTTVSLLISTRGRPIRNTMRVIAERGTVHLDLFHGFAVVESSTVSRPRKIVRPLLVSVATVGQWAASLLFRGARWEPAYPGLRELVRRFVIAARDGGPSPISAGETVDVAITMERLAAG